ncbi:MAG: hypothetical protein K2O01_04985, partial [Bacteroidales bacterium]|nr:hypothetical protein [Bacteroidales bacterium]
MKKIILLLGILATGTAFCAALAATSPLVLAADGITERQAATPTAAQPVRQPAVPKTGTLPAATKLTGTKKQAASQPAQPQAAAESTNIVANADRAANADTLQPAANASQPATPAPNAQPAKKQQPISIKFDVRADWEYHHYGEDMDDESGFTGKFLNFILDGNITDKFSYHFRYRFNKFNSTQDFFEATDWAYLNYDINRNWRVSAGKQVIVIGGYEYDKAPIDVYFYSDFCNFLPACYEFGISGQYTT